MWNGDNHNTVSNGKLTLEQVQQMSQVLIKDFDERTELDINKVLKRKGYPEFQVLLDFFLKKHPEYLL